MKISDINKTMLYAIEKGYTIDEKGNVYYKNKLRSLSINRGGYYSFTIRIKCDVKDVFRRVFPHKLQAYKKFKEQLFKQGMMVRHLDGNRLNNSEDNISFGTNSQNMQDMSSELRLDKAIYATSFVKKYNHEAIIKLHNEGSSYSEIMKELNIKSKGTISFIIKNSLESKNINFKS